MDLERPGTVFFEVVGEERFKKGDALMNLKTKRITHFDAGNFHLRSFIR